MRLIYRGDLDGTVCATLLMDVGLADELIQAHPKDMQDGKIEVKPGDIICNLPYQPNCGLWFDHHSSVIDSDDMPTDYKGLVQVAPSAAGLVYKYLLPDNPQLAKYAKLVAQTDKIDSADLTREQVTSPDGAFLLGFLLDPRTGMGFQRDLGISNYQWSLTLPKLLMEKSVNEVLATKDTSERVERYFAMQAEGESFFLAHSRLEGKAIVTDVRGLDVPPINRFLIYTLDGLSAGNISVRIADGKKGEFATVSIGYSIFDRSATVNCGQLCAAYGGGGHNAVATCQPTLDKADQVFAEIIEACRA